MFLFFRANCVSGFFTRRRKGTVRAGGACPERAAQTGAEACTAEKRRAGIRGTLTYVHFRGFKFNIPFFTIRIAVTP